ncbi:hypothetical protein LCGC14_0706600 [marine sediment metagenome]|uniref:Uncharacterized protein n=1 Tax=marine sediment metagenome TaxID=412755 RepID=A0A0F9QGB3_9ZZZZ|nr:MAG: hypothetical protein Lokiarch_14690 [Candidatus Lokiarchaeum sp. GC14_75]
MMLDYFLTSDLSQILEPLNQFFNGFNYFFYVLFKNGNFLFFFLFLLMGIVLLINAREIEYDERIHGKEELIKRRGRIGTILLILLAFGFLSKDLFAFIFSIFNLLPEPKFLVKFMNEIDLYSLENINTLDLGHRTLFFFVGSFSLISLLLIIIGIYLLLFNKFILRSKLKTFAFIGVGFFFWLLVGFNMALRLII